MSPETEAVAMPPDSPQMVSPMIPANVPTKERKCSLGELRDSGLIKYSPDYTEAWTEDHGKEVVPVAEGKEVKPHDALEHEPPADAKYVALPHDEKEHIHTARGGGGEEVETAGKRKRCGIALKWVVILATVIMLLAVGLGVGLALGLKKKGSTK